MLKSQQHLLKLSELREKINTHPADGDTEKLGKLVAEATDVERRYRAEVLVEAEAEARADTSGEGAELRSLRNAANVGDLFEAVVESRQVDGVLREYQQANGLKPNDLPIDLLIEERAVTPGATSVQGNQQAIEPYVFPNAVASFLGIPTPIVPVGDVIYPILTSELDVRTPAENAVAAETTGSFVAEVLTPSRLQASFFYSIEDAARFRGMDAALRSNLRDGLADGLDDQILVGTNGLLTGTNLANHNVTAATDYSGYLENLAYNRVDGRYAANVGDIRIVLGVSSVAARVGTYAHAGTRYRGNASNEPALEALMRVTGGIRASAHIADPDSSNRQNNVVRLGNRRDMVAPIWRGISLIPDNVTKLDNGQIKLTAIMLHAVKILRVAGFHKQQAQTA